ncbi:MAG: hypothetical protein JNK15_13820 [Planctomycetes bacterium]|nr:hypothetical protein [Planctomycetota bacterium]
MLLGLAVVVAACASTPATPEQVRLAERRLLGPFLVAREVGCGELLVELTGNFHPHVGQPATDKAHHSVVREQKDGFVETVWTNRTGQLEHAFTVTIGETPQFAESGAFVAGKQTRFRVVNQVRLRVYEGRRELTLNAAAGGGFVLVRDAGVGPKEVASFAITDGVLKTP